MSTTLIRPGRLAALRRELRCFWTANTPVGGLFVTKGLGHFWQPNKGTDEASSAPYACYFCGRETYVAEGAGTPTFNTVAQVTSVSDTVTAALRVVIARLGRTNPVLPHPRPEPALANATPAAATDASKDALVTAA